MKRIYLILALMVLLFAGPFIVYDYNIGGEEEAIIETSSTLEFKTDDISRQSVVNSDSGRDETQSSTSVSIKQTESTSSSELREENGPESSSESETVSVAGVVWQGPNSLYLNVKGDLLDLSDNSGKGTLINIWASWCEPCRIEMPYFEEAFLLYGDDINIIMMDALDSKPSETQEVAEAFFEEMSLSMPIYFDHEMNNQYLLGATLLPLTVILDEEGKVSEIFRGQVSPAKLKQMIDKIL